MIRKSNISLKSSCSGTAQFAGALLFRNSFIILALCSFLTGPSYAQIRAPEANTFRTTQYTSGVTRVDTIWIVCSDPGTVVNRLVANPPAGFPVVDIEWSKYNDTTYSYDPPFLSETGVSVSEAGNLTSGGYRARITDGGILDTLFHAWLFIDTPPVAATIRNFTCYYLALNGTAQYARFFYYDPGDNSKIELLNTTMFEWTSVPESDIPYPTLEIDPITYNPPFEDTWYYLTVTDAMGCSSVDSVFYESINVKADFEPQPAEGEAPLEVAFTNNSINGVAFYWDFGDEQITIEENPEPHIYYIPNEYEVKLGARSESGCTDTLIFQFIVVEPSALNVPNVFTPNADGINDYFFVAAKSLRSIHVRVMNRNGRKVYDFKGEGEALREWRGWDGKIGTKYASSGVYYYVINAVGWDDVQYTEKVYRGTLTLIGRK